MVFSMVGLKFAGEFHCEEGVNVSCRSIGLIPARLSSEGPW